MGRFALRTTATVALVGAMTVSGVVAATARLIDTPSAVTVLNESDISQANLTSIADLLTAVPTNVPSYRYGNDPSGQPTLDRDAVPAATPDVLGATVISAGTLGYGSLTDALTMQATHFGVAGQGLVDTQDYVLFVSSRYEATPALIPSGTDLYGQIDYPIGFDGLPGWQAQPAFPGDTWQGATLVLSGQWYPTEPFSTQLVDTSNSFAPVEFDGLFAVGSDWAIAAIDTATLNELGNGSIAYGFASHVHDGTYGFCDDCESIVTAYPQVPRTADDLFDLSLGMSIVLEPEPEPEPVPSPAASPSPVSVDEPDAGRTSGPPLVPLFLGLFMFVAIVGALIWWAYRRTGGERDCGRQLRAWEAAKRRLQARRELLESALEQFNERMRRIAELEAIKAEYSSALDGPRGGLPGGDFVRLEGQLIGYEDLQELIDMVDADLAGAHADAGEAKDYLDQKLREFEEAEAEERAAREAYEACIAASVAAADDAAAPTDDSGQGGEAAGGPTVATAPPPPLSSTPRKDCGCDIELNPDPKMVPVGPAQRFRLFRDFDVISAVDEASEHGADKVGAEMVTGLKDAGTTLETIGRALSGGGAVKSAAGAAASFQAGSIVKGSLQAVKGTVEGLSAAEVIPNVPTSLPEAFANGLAATANLGAFIAGKVTEWMGKNTLVEVRASYYFQWVSIQPTQIWECEDGVWKCRTRVNVYTVGTLERERGRTQQFTVKSDSERRAFNTHVARLASTGRNRITHSVNQIAQWEKANPPGDCP